MNGDACHATAARQAMKALVLDVLGVKRVADWCGVSEGAVYQWLSRATDAEPFPVKRLPAMMLGARREGVDFDEAIFWRLLGVEPAAAGTAQR